MPCYSPLTAYRSRELNSNGNRTIVFNPAQAYEPDNPLKLPCGQCIGCRLRYSAHWAARCYHESQMHPDNCFVTLTFNAEYLPPDGSISVRDCQLFLKRLRKKFRYQKIRIAYCGEYGEKSKRPHYHFLLFGFDFKDKYEWKTVNGCKYYRSKTLEELWPFGNSLIGEVTFESAAYVARYITKKMKGPNSWEHYTDFDKETGEVFGERVKEFFQTSRRPGIGKTWIEKFTADVYPSDEMVINGRKMRPPKFYDSQFEIVDPYTMDEIRDRRVAIAKSKKVAQHNTPDRLEVRETIQKLKAEKLIRRYENETTESI